MEEKVKIYHAKNKKEAEQLLLFLKANGIEGMKQPLGEGAYRDLYLGNKWYGEEILVEKKDEQRALAVIQAFTNAKPENKNNKAGVFGRVLVIGAVILVLLLGGYTWLPQIFG